MKVHLKVGSGRPPTPTAINELRGNPGRRDINTAEPKPRRILPPGAKPTSDDEITARRFRPPDYLDAEAVAEWERLVPILARMRVLTEADRSVLTHICILWSTAIKAHQTIRQLEATNAQAGLLYTSASGYITQNPLIGIRNNAMALYTSFVTQFGLTPASRSRLVTDEDGKQHKGGLLNGQWHRKNA